MSQCVGGEFHIILGHALTTKYAFLYLAANVKYRNEERMLTMPQRLTIRDMYAKGFKISEIANTLGIDRKTVSRHLTEDDFSPKAPTTKTFPSKLDPYKTIIAEWLEEDKKCFSKQRHTYRRIKERLAGEYGFECAYGTIADYVRKIRTSKTNEGFLDLAWQPGYAQVDFGQVDCVVDDEMQRCHHLVCAFPYSNDGFVQLFLGETGECFCEGLKAIFEFIGGVPPVIIFDNASGLGQRRKEAFYESELFCRFRLHYRFEARYCRPAAGNEKGCAERKVAFLRNQLFVPVPTVDDIKAFNEELLLRSRFQEDERHYAKGERIGDLFVKDQNALLPLPEKSFNCVRYEKVTSDGWGHVKVNGNHIYSSDPKCANAETIVGIAAHTITVMDAQGTILALHPREYGQKRTESIDTLSQLATLAKRPRGWMNSKVRTMLPVSVVTHLDGVDAETLRRDLKLLSESCRRSGQEATLGALEILAHEHEDFPDFFQVGVLASRIVDYGLDTLPVQGADLANYDAMFLGGGEHA
jgi:transposase